MTRPSTHPVLLVRPAERNDADLAALRRLHIDADVDPYLTVSASTDADAVDRAQRLLDLLRDHANWLVVTSTNAIDALATLTSTETLSGVLRVARDRGARFGAVGQATAKALHAYATLTVHVPSVTTAHGLADLVLASPAHGVVAFPHGDQALTTLPDRLRHARVDVHAAVVYATQAVPHTPRTAAKLAEGAYQVVVLRSPTAVRALHQYSPHLPATTTLVCGGPTTMAAAKRVFSVPIVDTGDSDPDTVAKTVAAVLAR